MLLAEAPATINERTQSRLTPISLACQAGSMSTIQILDSYGADFRLRDENGLTCLHTGKDIPSICSFISLSSLACLNGHVDVVQWLVRVFSSSRDTSNQF